MLWYVILVALSCFIQVQATEDSPRIIIVGAGASGIAAASRLFENGFTNVTILEAENRFGGRVFTKKFGEYWVDMGGQWVHGEEDNVSFELAWPLGLLQRSNESWGVKYLTSSGPTISDDASNEFMDFFFNMSMVGPPDEYLNRSIGEYYSLKIDEYFESHPEINSDLRNSLMSALDLFEMSQHAADSWFDVSVNHEEIMCAGDQAITWKERGYGTILDILMKRYPDPARELPVLNNTIFNTEVWQINYNTSSGSIRVITTDGTVYPADHVIVTPSVGVLKADYKTLFNPPLQNSKINAIENIELGSVAKIYLLYSSPWWIEPNSNSSENFFFNFLWTDADKKEYENDPEKSWLLSLVSATVVEHKSRLLLCWLTGPHAKKMENIPTDRVFEQVKEFFHRFIGRTHTLSEPVAMLRTNWYTNKHFRGTWSYRSLKTERSGAKAIDLESPIMNDNREPLVLFAGEATHSKHPSTVHGAIDSGWREARRLTQLYAGRSFLGTEAGIHFWKDLVRADRVLTDRLLNGSWRAIVARRKKTKMN